MKYVDEFRDGTVAQKLAGAIRKITTQPWTIMEVCGGQTHAIVRYGLDRLLPPEVTLIHGPGCPVCVTPIERIDAACQIASLPEAIFCSFGDMLRVPGSHGDLLGIKAQGGDVRVVYSPLDAIALAQQHPDRQIVNFAVGFETTAPAQAMAILQAYRLGLTNFSMLVAHVLVPPAMEAILSSPQNRVQGFLAAGHVCTIMGYEEYEPLATNYQVPIVVTGFEPVDILEGVHLVVQQLERGEHRVENQYSRSVQRLGNVHARHAIEEVFEVSAQTWRGLGEFPNSGLRLRPKYIQYDARERFHDHLSTLDPKQTESTECQSGLILQGQLKPSECPAFGTRCTPEHPLGAPMVSSEGACAAYYQFRKHEVIHT
jgi:hydrogenase expression/formation protein HypD